MTARGRTAGAFSSRGPLALGFLTLVLLGSGLFGWGAFASISGAVIAVGRVEVATRDQRVEHIDGGTVREVLVRNGDRVAAGDVALRLDDALLRSEETILAAELADLVARRNRLEAEFRDVGTVVWDADLVARASAEPAVQAILDGQQRLFEARRASRAGQVAQLRERIGQTRKQVTSFEAQGEAVEREIKFIARQLDAERELFGKGMTELSRFLQLEREAARTEGQAGDIEARIAAARGRIAEIEIQILQIDTKLVEEAEAQAREAQARENGVRERLASVRKHLDHMDIRAPVSGKVFDMQVFAPGEVVRPGEPILKIVPENPELVVRAQVEPIHVDQVWPGQEVVLLFSAFPARTTPEFEGRVLGVAADASHDERTGLSWYEVEVTMGPAIVAEEEMAAVAWARSVHGRLADRLAEIAQGWEPEDWPLLDRVAEHVGRWAKRPAAGDRDGPPGSRAGAGAGSLAVPAADARDLALVPGMPVEVRIRTGERSPLSYLAKPLTDYFSRSMREE